MATTRIKAFPQVTETRTVSTSATAEDGAHLTSAEHDEQLPRWEICRDAMLGTEGLRLNTEKAKTYLPQAPAEDDDEFGLRVARAEMYPAFKETVKGLTGMVFQDDPVLGKDVPPAIVDLWENIDGTGTHGAVFLRRVFEDAMQPGLAGVLVDYPDVGTGPGGRRLTLAEERVRGARPYWVHYTAEQIRNFRTQIVNGRTVLTLLVLEESSNEPVGDFGSEAVTRYRVFRRDPISSVVSFERFREADRDGDPPISEAKGVLQNANAIPFGVVYTGTKRATLYCFPPLIDLAYMNFSHVQVLSDYRTSLHMASVPLLVTKGRPRPPSDPNRPDDGEGDELVISAGRGIDLPGDQYSDAKYIEHAGSALSASRTELQDIEKRMAAQGLSMLQSDTRAAETAEAKRIDRKQQNASLTSAARSMQDMGEALLAFTAVYMGLETGGSITMLRDFTDKTLDTERLSALGEARARGDISLETYWQLLIAGSALPEDFDPVVERERLDNETIRTGVPGLPGGTDDADPDPDAGAGADTEGDGGDRQPAAA